MLTIRVKIPKSESGENLVRDEYEKLIQRAILRVTKGLGGLDRYVPEFDVTFQRRYEGTFSPMVTAVISSKGVALFAFVSGKLLEPGVTTPPTEDEIVAGFYELHDVIIDYVGFKTIVWDRVVDRWVQLRESTARLMGS